jgi:hypothetical protein
MPARALRPGRATGTTYKKEEAAPMDDRVRDDTQELRMPRAVAEWLAERNYAGRHWAPLAERLRTDTGYAPRHAAEDES